MTESMAESQILQISESTKKFKELINHLRRKKQQQDSQIQPKQQKCNSKSAERHKKLSLSKVIDEKFTKDLQSNPLIENQDQNSIYVPRPKLETQNPEKQFANQQYPKQPASARQPLELADANKYIDGQEILASKRSKKNLLTIHRQNQTSRRNSHETSVNQENEKQSKGQGSTSESKKQLTSLKKVIFNPFKLLERSDSSLEKEERKCKHGNLNKAHCPAIEAAQNPKRRQSDWREPQQNLNFEEEKEQSEFKSTIQQDLKGNCLFNPLSTNSSGFQSNSSSPNKLTQKKLNLGNQKKCQRVPKIKNIPQGKIVDFFSSVSNLPCASQLTNTSEPRQIYAFFEQLYLTVEMQEHFRGDSKPFIKKYKNCVYCGQEQKQEEKYEGFLYYFDQIDSPLEKNTGIRFYYGEFLNVQKHDHGTQIQFLPAKQNRCYRVWIGSFKNGKKTGKFLFTDPSEQMEYVGLMLNGKYSGEGKLTTKRSVYEGMFENGEKHGYGQERFFQTGLRYEGEYVHGKFTNSKVKRVEIGQHHKKRAAETNSRVNCSEPQFERSGHKKPRPLLNSSLNSAQRVFNHSPLKLTSIKRGEENHHEVTENGGQSQRSYNGKTSSVQSESFFVKSRRESLSKIYLKMPQTQHMRRQRQRRREAQHSRGESSLAYRKKNTEKMPENLIANAENSRDIHESPQAESIGSGSQLQPRFVHSNRKGDFLIRQNRIVPAVLQQASTEDHIQIQENEVDDEGLPKPSFYPFE